MTPHPRHDGARAAVVVFDRREGEATHMLEAVMFWNEPNNKSHWDFETHDPEWRIFSQLVRQAGAAVRAENASLPRILGGMSPIDASFLGRMANQGALEAVDAV